MTDRYVRSTDGSDASDGLTWANAEATLTGAAAADAAGDTIFVSDAHAESTGALVSLAWAGTATSPTRVICGDDVAEPPTAVATTATVTSTGNFGISLNVTTGFYVYYYGISFFAGTGNSAAADIICASGAGTTTHLESCALRIVSTNGGAIINTSDSSVGFNRWVNTDVRFAAAAQFISVAGTLHWNGGSIISGGTSPTNLLAPGLGSEIIVENCDFSNGAAGMHLTNGAGACSKTIFRNCKLPATWTGSLASVTPSEGAVFEMFNCDSGDTNYKYRRQTKYGQLDHELTIIRTGGASDGATGISWKLVSLAGMGTASPIATLDAPDIVFWNDAVGSADTVTVEIVHDSVTALTDAEVWLEVRYLGTSGAPLGLFVSDRRTTELTTAAAQASSSATWTTTGLTNPNKQALSVTFTPQEIGFYRARVRLAKPSYTIYVCPFPSDLSSAKQVQIPGCDYLLMPAAAASGGGMRMAGHGGLAA